MADPVWSARTKGVIVVGYSGGQVHLRFEFHPPARNGSFVLEERKQSHGVLPGFPGKL